MSQVTKRALEASLKKLLLERPLDKITVTDIAEDCGINRMTFYYHFRDIYDLVEWACQEDARRILDGKRTYTTWQEGFRRILDGLIDNRPFILNVYRSVRREQVETFLFQVTHGLLMGVVEELDPRGEVREEDKAFLADFYKYAFSFSESRRYAGFFVFSELKAQGPIAGLYAFFVFQRVTHSPILLTASRYF